MNEEEKKAIDYFSKKVDKLKENLEKGLYYGEQYQVREDIKHLETVLNLIEKQQAEIEDLKWKNEIYVKSIKSHQSKIETLKRDFEIVDHECSRLEKEDIKKDKIIDLMAICMEQTGTGRRSFSCIFRQNEECNENGCRICIKKYFERKIEK